MHGFDEFWVTSIIWIAMEILSIPIIRSAEGQGGPAQSPALPRHTPTTRPSIRVGQSRKQKIEDDGPLPPHPIEGIKYNMETVDEVIRDKTIEFIDKAKAAGKPFFIWYNPRACMSSRISRRNMKGCATRRWLVDRGSRMAQMDDCIGAVMQHLKDEGLDDNTIVVFSTDNGTENFTWPDGGQTPFAGGKGYRSRRWLPRSLYPALPGKVPAGKIDNSIISGLDWSPPLSPPRETRISSRSFSPVRRSAARTTRCISTATTSSTSSPQIAVGTKRDLLLSPSRRSRGSHRRLQIPLH